MFDIAFIDNKGFSERITTAHFSPLGQQCYVKTKCALAVAAPTTLAPDPTRVQHPENQEPAIAALYGNPTNNFLHREVTFNPDGLLRGARALSIIGNYAYVCCNAGLVVVSLEEPKRPFVMAVVDEEFFHHSVQAQFRYAFVGDQDGLKVLDITDLAHPVPTAKLEIEDVHNIYVART